MHEGGYVAGIPGSDSFESKCAGAITKIGHNSGTCTA